MSKPTILETIYAQRALDVELAESTPGTTFNDITTLLSLHLAPPLASVISRLKTNPTSHTNNPSPSLMAEIKRASPSKGPIALTTNVAQQALTYALAGASVISVLTEPKWFKGSLFDMRMTREAVAQLPNRPAILRKDFILSTYQIAEARLYGADTVLLIVAMLSQEKLKSLYDYSLSLGMEPLVEVNNAEEMERALSLGAKVIGVNNRNLHDFNVDMGTTTRIAEMVKDRRIILCALSGISTHADVEMYQKDGVGAVLVGEALMRASDPGSFIHDLLGWPKDGPSTSSNSILTGQAPFIKVDGIQSAAEASFFMAAKTDLIGLIFDPSSPKSVALETGEKISRDLHELRRNNSGAHSHNLSISTRPPPLPWFTSQAYSLLTSSPSSPLLVGVFKDKPLEYVIRAVYTTQLDLVQFNGSEPTEWALQVPVPVIRRVDLSSSASPDADTTLVLKEALKPGFHKFLYLFGDKNTNWELVKQVIGEGEAKGWPLPILGRAETAEYLDAEGGKGIIQWGFEFEQPAQRSLEDFGRLIRSVKHLK